MTLKRIVLPALFVAAAIAGAVTTGCHGVVDDLRDGDAESGSDVRNVHADSNGDAGWSDTDAVADADVISTAGK